MGVSLQILPPILFDPIDVEVSFLYYVIGLDLFHSCIKDGIFNSRDK